MDSIKAKEDFRGFIACINSVAPEKHRVKLRESETVKKNRENELEKEGEKVNRRERGRKIREEREINREREGGRKIKGKIYRERYTIKVREDVHKI